MSIAVRAGSRADAELLSRLHDASFDETWNAEAIEILLGVPGTFALLAGIASGDWQSFALIRVAADEAEILSLGTTPQARRRGLAHALVLASAEQAATRGAAKFFLEVSVGNGAARALYASLGFAEVGVRRGYYRHLDGPAADALTLATALPLARRAPL